MIHDDLDDEEIEARFRQARERQRAEEQSQAACARLAVLERRLALAEAELKQLESQVALLQQLADGWRQKLQNLKAALEAC